MFRTFDVWFGCLIFSKIGLKFVFLAGLNSCGRSLRHSSLTKAAGDEQNINGDSDEKLKAAQLIRRQFVLAKNANKIASSFATAVRPYVYELGHQSGNFQLSFRSYFNCFPPCSYFCDIRAVQAVISITCIVFSSSKPSHTRENDNYQVKP